MADDPRQGSKRDYIQTLDALTKQVYALEDEAVKRAMRLLQDALAEINSRVITADGWRLENLQNLQRQVDDIMRNFMAQYGAEFASIQSQAWAIGVDSVDQPLKVSGLFLNPARLNPSIVAVLQGFSADLIRNITDQTRTTINATIAQSMLGRLSPFDAQKRLTQIIGAHDRLRDLTGISARAEAQFRTEVGRVYSIATQARQEQIAETAPDIRKAWAHKGSGLQPRSGHLAAHGQTVRVDEFFLVSPKFGKPAEELMYPRDPRGSAENTINCGCRSVTWREGYGDVLPRTTARVDALKQRAGIEARDRRYWMVGL